VFGIGRWLERQVMKLLLKRLEDRLMKGVVFEWKKLLVAVIGVVITFFGEALGIPESLIQNLIAIIAAFLVGQGLADFGKGKEVARIKAASRGLKVD
jgi:fatty acid desaturase